MSETKPQNTSAGAPQCVGRFNFALPVEFARVGGEQRIYLTRAWNEAISAGSNPALLWTARVAGLGGSANQGGSARILKEFNLTGLGPAVWYRPLEAHPDDLKLLAMKAVPDYSLFLEANATSGRERIAEQVVTQLAASFAANSTNGFCLQHGAFVIAPSKNERANATFSGGGVEVRVETETVAAPDDGGSDTSPVDGIRILLKQSHVVADMTGNEERAHVTHKNAKPELVYSWIYAGKAADGFNPRIHLSASAAEDRRAALDAAWTMVLESLRRRPTGVKP